MPTVLDEPVAAAAGESRVLTPAGPLVVELPQVPSENAAGEQACTLPGCEPSACRVSGCAPRRWAFLGLGSVCFAIAAAGVVLPVVPTTFPLMCSLLFFARSSPLLERKVRTFPLFRPYIKYIDGSTPMPLRAKIVSCLLMWTPVSITSYWLANHTEAPAAAWIGTLMLAVIGTPVIFFWRPKLIG